MREGSSMSRSTADAELNSLSEGLHEELLPAVQLLRPLLDALAPTPVVREDNRAVYSSCH